MGRMTSADDVFKRLLSKDICSRVARSGIRAPRTGFAGYSEIFRVKTRKISRYSMLCLTSAAGTHMTSKYPSFRERSEFVAEIVGAYRDGKKLDHDSFFNRACELWPCSHRISIVSETEGVKCKSEDIRKQILTDEEFLDSTYTADIYWNCDEVTVGRDAVAAGFAEVAANTIDCSADLLAAAEILRRLFEGSALPFLSGDYSNEYEDQPGHWVQYITSMEPADAMLHLFYHRICSVEYDEVWSQEKKDAEFQRLSRILEEYEGDVRSDRSKA